MTDLTNSRIPLNPPDPAELISYIPYHLKFKPADSLVVLTAHRKLRELGISFLARMDIDTLFDPAAAARARTGFVANLVHQSAREGFMVLYSEELFTTLTSETLQNPGVEDRTALITLELARWYDIEHFRPTRTYVVGETRWRCLACPRAGHCPAGGHPTSVFSHTSVAAEMVARGKYFAPSRADLVVLPPAPPRSVEIGRASCRERV